MASTVAEVVWIVGLLQKLCQYLPSATILRQHLTLQIAANPVFHKRTKHINIDCHFIKDKDSRWIDCHNRLRLINRVDVFT